MILKNERNIECGFVGVTYLRSEPLVWTRTRDKHD